MHTTANNISQWVPSWPRSNGGFQSVFSPQYIGHEQDEACRQACDHKLVDGEDVFQRVDPLLHGAGVEVVIDASSNAPQRPHSVNHQRHGEADREAQLQQVRQPLSTTGRTQDSTPRFQLDTEQCQIFSPSETLIETYGTAFKLFTRTRQMYKTITRPSMTHVVTLILTLTGYQ